eukprot:6201920-Pleurochrysis_carterae.AAC.2
MLQWAPARVRRRNASQHSYRRARPSVHCIYGLEHDHLYPDAPYFISDFATVHACCGLLARSLLTCGRHKRTTTTPATMARSSRTKICRSAFSNSRAYIGNVGTSDSGSSTPRKCLFPLVFVLADIIFLYFPNASFFVAKDSMFPPFMHSCPKASRSACRLFAST